MTPTRARIGQRIAEYRKDEKRFLKRYANRTWSRDWFVSYEHELFDAKALWAASYEPPIKTKNLNTRDARNGFSLFPEFRVVNLSEQGVRTYTEGKRLYRETTYFARNPQLVDEAKKKHGMKCMACDFDFKKQYGQRGEGFIEVHHLNQMKLDKERQSSVKDVVVLCANCHRMIERKPLLKLSELKKLVTKKYT
jgi:hypothetical protein